ncbi:MAG TPA: MYXO-CTERM sorting domain-containing protein, partial [Polyangiales bacterium]|nr:MYXO-CTERM sorting domain-containing protein [Polyangiales bacterium]
SGDIAPSVGTTAPIYNGGSTSASTAPQTPTAEHDTGEDNSVGMHAKACSVSAPGARDSGAAWFALIAAGLALAVSRRRHR